MFKNQFYFIIIFSVFFTNFVVAQNRTISGTVVDSKNDKTIEYVSISILNSVDYSLITGGLSKKNGSFSIPNVNTGKYVIKFYFLGYETLLLEKAIVESNTQIQLGTIKLKRTNQSLDEVVILSKRKDSYNKIDKQQYQANQFQTSMGGSAIDVVKNLPSVTVNGQGDISLRGSNGFMVLVNGKPILTDAATVLSQLPANTIENIELITAPSAKYDPDGKGGIINIVTIKGTTDGFAIATNLMGGLPSTDDYNNLEKPKRFGGDITLNYKKNKVDFAISANYQRNDVNGYREGDVFTKNFDNKTITRFPSSGERSFDKHNYSSKASLIYSASKNDIFNVGFFVSKKFQARRADIVYNNATSNLITNAILKNTYFNSNVQTKEGTFTLSNLDYSHTFQNKSILTSSILYEQANLFGNTINKNLDYPAKSFVFQEVTNPYDNPISGFRFKLDYVIPTKIGKWESGYQFRNDIQKGNFGYTLTPEAIPPVDNSEFRGSVQSKNQINSVYSQYAAKVNKLSYVVGLRYEYSARKVILSSDVNPHFLNLSNLFPSANLLYTFNNAWNVKAGYSKRVQRNNNFELNPIPEREHSETLEQGDPDLLPQFVDLAELGLNHTFKKGTVFTTFYYQNIKNPIQRVNSVYADTILNRVFTNAEKARLFGFEFGTNYKPQKWVSMFVGGNIYNYKISGNLNVLEEISAVNNSNWVYSLNANSTFNLEKNWSFTANVNFTSAKPTAQGEDSRFLSPNLAVKKTILAGKGSLGFQWQNLNFGSMQSNQQRITTFGDDFYTTTNYIYETNVLLFNFSYSFNKLMSKNKFPTSEIGEKEF
jgi:outer membrane receptor protein involved in Fe transport